MSRLEMQVQQNGWIICSDEHGVAWGEGKTVEQAVDDWELSAKRLRTMLRRAEVPLGPMMAHRLAILDHYASQRGWDR